MSVVYNNVVVSKGLGNSLIDFIPWGLGVVVKFDSCLIFEVELVVCWERGLVVC